MDLFCEFKWNNMMHGSVESLIHTVLDLDAESDDEDDMGMDGDDDEAYFAEGTCATPFHM
jgi:hypothetical protein